MDEESKNMCVIVTHFGKFRYKRLPMGVSQATDLCQEIMESILRDIPEVEVFLDDIGISLMIMFLTCVLFAKFLLVCNAMDSRLTHWNVNGQFKKQIGSDIA